MVTETCGVMRTEEKIEREREVERHSEMVTETELDRTKKRVRKL